MSKKVLWLLALLALMGPWRIAQAQTCKCASNNIEVFPNKTQAAPRNTQIWVRLPAVSSRLTYGKYIDFQNYPTLWASSYTMQLMQLHLLLKGQPIAVKRLDFRSAQWRMINLQPVKPLEAGKTYQLRLSVGTWSSEIGSFRTSGEISNAPPPKPQVSFLRFIWDRQVGGMCLSPSPYAVLKLAKLPDPNNAPLMGVWLPGSNGMIDTTAQPVLIMPSQQKQHFLGRHAQCAENNLPFTTDKIMKVGVRFGDLAGNWGPVEELSFAKGAFLQPWTWSPNGRVFFWIALAFLIFLVDAVRAWVFQRVSNEKLDDYIATNTSIENDSALLALRRMVQSEKPLRLGGFLLGVAQFLLVSFGLYVFFRASSHFAVSQSALIQLRATFFPIATALFFHWLVNLSYIIRIRLKRKKIASLTIAPSFQKSSQELLKGWK